MSRWHPIDDTAALREARKLIRKGMPAAAAAREAAAKVGTPARANTLRNKLSREDGRATIRLALSTEELAALQRVAGRRPNQWLLRVIRKALQLASGASAGAN